ncbi:MAG TPA: hypothetical protein VN719_08360 [Gemmatimonadales bacterium]|nr:hypothetical protein [Gemmatimonadales bacterium]
MFPTEIEADFAHWYPNEDLLWWHRGELDERGKYKMSSRRLCVLLQGLDPYSLYKTSQRGGYLPERDLVLYETHNEMSKLRAAYYAIKGGEESRYEAFTFVDPIVRIERTMAEAEIEEDTHDASEQLYGEMGL